ncbi:MAG: hypothetical protein HYX50_00030 [Chloroflexi bacterium]|nr:hypothetical protein [Chloroflexota bacterium]
MSATAPATDTPPATAVQDNAPTPTRVTFAPGDLVDLAGRAGIVFVDPLSGAAEGWTLPGSPQDFTIDAVPADGSLLLYRCTNPKRVATPAECGPPGASYLFDTQSQTAIRLDTSGADLPPTLLWPSSDEMLLVGKDGASIASTTATGGRRVRTIDLPDGYRVVRPETAAWDRGGSRLLVLATQALCATPPASSAPGCGGANGAAQVFLLNRNTSDAVALGEPGFWPSFQWSPDGSKVLVVRVPDANQRLAAIDVVAADGTLLWSQTRPSIFANAQWSPDGSSIAMNVMFRADNLLDSARLDVLDGAIGQTRYRILRALACEGRLWNADGSLLILPFYDEPNDSAVADPATGTIRDLGFAYRPSLSDPNEVLGVTSDTHTRTLFALDLRTGARRDIVRYSVTLTGWPLYEGPAMVGGRLVYTGVLALGRGGCGEGLTGSIDAPPAFEFPPFADGS